MTSAFNCNPSQNGRHSSVLPEKVDRSSLGRWTVLLVMAHVAWCERCWRYLDLRLISVMGFVLSNHGKYRPHELVTEEVSAKYQFLKMPGRKFYWCVTSVRVMMSEESGLTLEIAA